MKCHICGSEIPEGRKYCPGCGRVVRQQTEQNKSNRSGADYTRAASSASVKPENSEIDGIFNFDPNAPEYKDPYAYDRADAHAEEYDRMFVSRKKQQAEPENTYTDSSTKHFKPVRDNTVQDDDSAYTKRIHIKPEPADEDTHSLFDSDEEEDYDEDYDDSDTPEKKPVNFKLIGIIVAVALALAIISTGIYSIGKSVGLWGDTSTQQGTADHSDEDENNTPNNKNDEDKDEDKDKDKDSEEQTSAHKTGYYTVSTDLNNIFMYKSATDQRIIATIPDGTLINITDVNGEFGKTEYKSFVGWVAISDLKFTPNEAPETTTKQEETTTEPASGEAEPAFPAEPGIYTVVTTDAGLNVRNTNSTAGDVIAVIPNGETVEVLEVKSSWGKIYMDGAEAWVYMKYLK